MRVAIAAFALALASAIQGQTALWPTPLANEFWHLKAERIQAYRDRDRAYFERLLADNFVGLGPDGRITTRAEYLANEFGTESTQAPKVETEVQNFAVSRTGATVALFYQEVERVKVGESTFETKLGRLDVYVRSRGRWQLQTMTAVRLPEAPTTIAVPIGRLSDYVGRYQYGPGILSVVRLVDGKLLEQSTGNAEVQLLPVAPDVFYSPPDLEGRVEFERDASGRVIAQIYRSGSQRLRAERLD